MIYWRQFVFCPNCGSKISEAAKFCRECGCDLTLDTQQAQPTDNYDMSRVANETPSSSIVNKAARTTIQIVGRTIQIIAWLTGSGLTGGCLVAGVLTLFIMNGDGTPITGIPSRFIGIPMIIFCPITAIPAWLLFYVGARICGDDLD